MKSPRDWSVYLVRCADESLYTGVAKDVSTRVAVHNSGRGAAYTRSRLPVSLVYHKKGMTRSAALVEEARIKSLQRPGKLALLKKASRALGAAAMLWFAASPAAAVPVFNRETTVMIASAAPQAFTGESTYAPLRMYYIHTVSTGVPHASSGTAVLSATSVDGAAWTKEAGVRLSTGTAPSVSAEWITGCALQPLTGGGYRMLYSIVSSTGAFRIHSATSADGLGWANQSGVVVDGVSTYVGVPRIVVLNSGDWRLYYTRDVNGGDDLADRQIFSALSTDQGASWGASAVVLSTNAYEAGAAKLTDGTIRLFYTQPPSAGSSATVVMSAISATALGNSFTIETGARVSTPSASGALSFPVPVRSTDSFRWRLYYSLYDASVTTGDVRAALTGSPAPVSASPATIYRSAGGASLTIAGEVFSTGPGVSISKSGVVVTGTSVNRASDQSLSASFATQGLELGLWDVTVTNADGVPGAAAGTLTIDFQPGTVSVVGNLLRPREGVPTVIDVNTFNAGRITVRVYDLEGRPIRTLFDGERPEGTSGFTWDGKNAAGASVPSGLYFVAVSGPKVSAKSKIVVIR